MGLSCWDASIKKWYEQNSFTCYPVVYNLVCNCRPWELMHDINYDKKVLCRPTSLLVYIIMFLCHNCVNNMSVNLIQSSRLCTLAHEPWYITCIPSLYNHVNTHLCIIYLCEAKVKITNEGVIIYCHNNHMFILCFFAIKLF